MTEHIKLNCRKNLLGRLTALVLALTIAMGLLPYTAVNVEAASGSWMWKFTKVTTIDDLPTDSEWHPAFVAYEYDGETYVMNTTKGVGREKTVCKFEGTKVKGAGSSADVAGWETLTTKGYSIPDVYNGDFPYGIWIKWAGRDTQNEYMPKYYIRDADGNAICEDGNTDGLVNYTRAKKEYSSGDLKDVEDNVKKKSHGSEINKEWYTPWTIMTGKKEGNTIKTYESTTKGKVKIFVNREHGYDYNFEKVSKSSDVSLDYHDWMSDYYEFTMYVGTRVEDTSISAPGTRTYSSNQTGVLQDAAIGLGETITVEKDATLIIRNNVYFNGTIENYGTVIVEDGVLQTTYQRNGLSDTTAYGCYRGYSGSSLVVLAGSIVIAGGDTSRAVYNYGRKGTGIELYGGSVINKGTIVAPYGVHMSDSSEIINKSSGSLLVGYKVKLPLVGSRQDMINQSGTNYGKNYTNYSWSDVTSSIRSVENAPVIMSFSWDETGEKRPIVQNTGYMEVNGGLINISSLPLEELDSAEKAEIFIANTVSQNTARWNSFKNVWGMMYNWWRTRNVALW